MFENSYRGVLDKRIQNDFFNCLFGRYGSENLGNYVHSELLKAMKQINKDLYDENKELAHSLAQKYNNSPNTRFQTKILKTFDFNLYENVGKEKGYSEEDFKARVVNLLMKSDTNINWNDFRGLSKTEIYDKLKEYYFLVYESE